MSIKHRLAKLEQRLCSGVGKVDVKMLTDEQLCEIVRRGAIDEEWDMAMRQLPSDKAIDALCDWLREEFTQETGQDCRDWSNDRCLEAFSKIIFS